MNHLAHALIADRTGTSITGNLLGDFVKGRPEDGYDGVLLEGIRLHRLVDRVTDDHPAFVRSRSRLAPPFRRYAGVLVDVFWDHFLARRWTEYAQEPLREFVDEVYATLRRDRGLLPERMLGFVDYMVEVDLLASYAERDGVARALAGVSRRMRRANPLGRAREPLDRHYEELEADFVAFFPDLLRRVGG